MSYEYHWPIKALGLKFLIETVSQNQAQIIGGILRSLPDYFGYEPAIVEYCLAAAASSSVTSVLTTGDGRSAGFTLGSIVNQSTVELLAMGVVTESQRQGLGTALLESLAAHTRASGQKFIMAKTYGPSDGGGSGHGAFDFFCKNDFFLLAEYDFIWKDRSCGIMVRRV